MNSTRIFRVLSQLTITELNRFNKFIQSPYHNVNARINGLAVKLIDSIKNNRELEDKETIWNSIETKKSYTDLKFRKLCNDLLERFEKFLIIENLENNKILQSNLLLESIRNDKIEILAEKHMTKSAVEFDREIDQSSNFYLQKYFYEKTIQNLKTNYEKKVNLKKGKDSSYADLIKNLDAFYLIEKLRIAIDIQTWKKMYKSTEEFELGIPLNIFDNFEIAQYHAVDIYRTMFNLYNDDELTNDYYTLKNKAFKHIDTFPKDEQREIFDVLVSYCIKWVNKENMDFHKETLTVYDWGISENIILNKGILSPTSFRNYVIIGLRVGEFDKVENFIKSNIDLLDKERRENALNFNLARVAFYRKQFQDCVSYLSRVNYDDIWYNVNSKMLLIAAYYELEEIAVLESTNDAFITFIRREKSLDINRRTAYLNFSSYLKKIISNYDSKKLIKIKEKIISNKEVYNKTWLLEKIEDLL